MSRKLTADGHGIPDGNDIAALTAIVGQAHALTPDRHDLAHYTHENRDIIKGRTPLVLKPASTEEVSRIVTYAADRRLALVPQGGHTGHTGGGAPSEAGNEIVIVLSRMNRIRETDVAGQTMTVEAGCILANIQQAADKADLLFPLSLASEGSCQIGGNISTNAGGTGVLAYGNTRDLVLGIEAVLPDGRVWNGLGKLKKNNTGYDLKQLFIGGEGTLGIVTAATLRLFPKPRGKSVAMVAMADADQALEFYQLMRGRAGSGLTAFEIMPRIGFDFVFRHAIGLRDPFGTRHNWNVLVEVTSSHSESEARKILESGFEAGFEAGLIADGVLAESSLQAEALWSIRETLPSTQKREGWSLKHDVSVPVHRVPEFLKEGEARVLEVLAGARVVAFGHMGDGNIHFNISEPEGMGREAFVQHAEALHDAVHSLVVSLDGSVSAEHGIGVLKRDLLASVKSETEMNMMRAVKRALDPDNIMSPGRILEL